ncbi:MAG: TetR/AcrR family transcriptional regulator [Lachnospiraceae bacterium]
MTKLKGSIAEETKKRIISSAQTVFLEKKFNEASLRQICKSAGVTTGALYCFYKDKDGLFEELLRPFVAGFSSILEDHFHKEESSKANEDIVSRDFISNFINFREAKEVACSIFLLNLEHPYCQTAQEKFVDLFSQQTKSLLKQVNNSNITVNIFNDDTIQWFSHLQVDMLLQVLGCSLPREKAIEQMLIYVRFLRGGFLELVAPRFPDVHNESE